MTTFRRLRNALRSPTARVEHLRTIIGTIRENKRLDDLPENLAALLVEYDQPHIEPNLRYDVQELLAGSTEMARILLNPAFSADEAMTLISNQLTILSKVQRYLATRPAVEGYSILAVHSSTLIGQFATREEGERQLQYMRTVGRIDDALVVPVRIVSTYALQPQAPASEPTLHHEDDIPDAIKPSFATHGFVDLPLATQGTPTNGPDATPRTINLTNFLNKPSEVGVADPNTPGSERSA